MTNNFIFGIKDYVFRKYKKASASQRTKEARMEFTARGERSMASLGALPPSVRREILRSICERTDWRRSYLYANLTLWAEAEPKLKTSSRETQNGGVKTMHKYEFKFYGGAKKLNQANYKFHAFIVDTSSREHHLYGALKNGLVEHTNPQLHIYASATPVVKVFTATSGFGVAKEYFSYFIMLMGSEGSRQINIKPLGFTKLGSYSWNFSGVGRFMTKDEIRRFFGADSDTWKFYNRQSFLSRQRLSELVQITEVQSLNVPLKEEHEEVRMLRLD